jgi:Trk K+ transport system NAD-binding subunit
VEFQAGSGTNPEALRQAGVGTCDFFIACTGLDEVNVLACVIANRLPSPTTICLVSRDDLLPPVGDVDLLQQEFGIVQTGSPTYLLAASRFNICGWSPTVFACLCSQSASLPRPSV